MKLDAKYWQERYQNEETGWDVGYVTPPIKTYVDQLNDKSVRILIPGAGNSYEAEYLWQQGYKNVFVVDFAESPLKNLKNRIPDFPSEQLIRKDFFLLKDQFDLIMEQTFFCALDPSLRNKYAEKMHQLLKPDGKLVGLLFNDTFLSGNPPFGGNKEEYISYFRPLFDVYMEPCYNSIPQRAGRELWISLKKSTEYNVQRTV